MFGIDLGFAWKCAYYAMRTILKSPGVRKEEKLEAIETFIGLTNKIVKIYNR